MKKRLRKKLHRGEYNWLGFEVECRFEPELSVTNDESGLCEVDRFVDSFIELIESLGLGCGGGCAPDRMEHYVSRYIPGRRKPSGKVPHRRGHCTDEHRAKVEAWLRSKPFVTNVVVSPLTPEY